MIARRRRSRWLRPRPRAAPRRGAGAVLAGVAGADADVGVARDFVGLRSGARGRRRGAGATRRAGAGVARRARAPGPRRASRRRRRRRVPSAVGWLVVRSRPRAGSRCRRARPDDHGWPAAGVSLSRRRLGARCASGAATIFARDAAAARAAGAIGWRAPARRWRRRALGPLRAGSRSDARLSGRASSASSTYLRAGDAYQVNLARRLSATLRARAMPVGLAAALRARAPAPHARLVSRADGGRARWSATRPSASWRVDGRRRGRDAADQGDAAARRRRATAIAPARPRWPAPAKERAEHVMIVDLERNDLGPRLPHRQRRRSTALARVVALPTVFHLVSTVRGRLRARRRPGGAARARRSPAARSPARPRGARWRSSTSSSRRARGPYTGATGWLGAAGDLDLAVAIRTALVRGGRLTLSVGGGIVADSRPAASSPRPR